VNLGSRTGRAGTAIVISPLIALMQDQVAALTQLWREPRSSIRHSTAGQQRNPGQRLLRGDTILYVAP
jgi:ATP-dependent DNA helicase RecQ